MCHVIIPGTEAEARAILGRDETPVLVDFYAEWCGSCSITAKLLARQQAAGHERLLMADSASSQPRQ